MDGGVKGNSKLVEDKVVDGDVEVVGGGVIGTPKSAVLLFLAYPGPKVIPMMMKVNISQPVTIMSF